MISAPPCAGSVARASQNVSVFAPSGRVSDADVADLVGNLTSRIFRNCSAANAVNVSVAGLPVVVRLRLPGKARDNWNSTAFRRNLTHAVAADLGVADAQVTVAADTSAVPPASPPASRHRRLLDSAELLATASVSGLTTSTQANGVADGAQALAAAGSSTAAICGSAPVRLDLHLPDCRKHKRDNDPLVAPG